MKNTNQEKKENNSRRSKRAAPKDNSLKAEFTPGPWRLRAYSFSVMDDYGNSCWSGNIGPDQPVTKGDKKGAGHILSTSAFGIFGRSPKEAEANARLIAAAPTLYEAAAFALSVLNANPIELSERMAIEKLDTALGLARGSNNQRAHGITRKR